MNKVNFVKGVDTKKHKNINSFWSLLIDCCFQDRFFAEESVCFYFIDALFDFCP